MISNNLDLFHVRDCFIAEIIERKLTSKILNKSIASFDYFGKYLIVLSAASGSTSRASFATVIGAYLGIARAGFSLAFSISTDIVKIFFKNNTKEKEKA